MSWLTAPFRDHIVITFFKFGSDEAQDYASLGLRDPQARLDATQTALP
jgi:hypothetical protein